MKKPMILDHIYDAAIDDAAFAALPARLAEAVGARSATIQVFNAQRELEDIAWCYASDEMMAYFVEQEFWRHDVWAGIAFRECGDGIVISTEDYLPTSAFKHSVMYNEYFRRFGDDTVHCIGTNLRTDAASVQLGLQRADRAAAFGPEEVAALQRLTPHIRRAMTVRERLARATGEAAAHRHAVDRMPVALIRLDRDGGVIFMNASAERLMGAEDGVAVRNRRLVLDEPAAQTALDHAVRQAAQRTGGRGGALGAVRRSLAASYRIVVGPTGPERDGSVLVLIDDPAAPHVGLHAVLVSMFGLTGAEAALAVGLTQGRTPEEVARTRDIRLSTVRSQVRGLLSKTERRRLTEVVIDLSRIAAITPRD